MSRLTNALLDKTAFGGGLQAPALDFTYGGMQGYAPDLTQWVSNQAQIRRNLMCILVEAPAFFQLMPNPDKWVASLRSLVETHAKTIDGLNATLEVETDTHNVGGAGELQDEVTNVTRARTTPSFTFVEKYGMPIGTFLHNWIDYGLMNPDTKYASAGTLPGIRPADMLADWYSMTCLFIEPDPTFNFAVKSWLVTNMYPKSTGEIIGKKDLTAASEITTLSVDFTGIAQYGLGVNIVAQRLLAALNISNANPYLRPAFLQDLGADVKNTPEGFSVNTNRLAQTAVPGVTVPSGRSGFTSPI